MCTNTTIAPIQHLTDALGWFCNAFRYSTRPAPVIQPCSFQHFEDLSNLQNAYALKTYSYTNSYPLSESSRMPLRVLPSCLRQTMTTPSRASSTSTLSIKPGFKMLLSSVVAILSFLHKALYIICSLLHRAMHSVWSTSLCICTCFLLLSSSMRLLLTMTSRCGVNERKERRSSISNSR